MKKSALLLALVLLITAVFSTGCSWISNTLQTMDDQYFYAYADADDYTIGDGEIDAEGITDIELNWVSGSVDVSLYDGDTISVTEQTDTASEDKKLRWLSKDGQLTVQFSKSVTSALFNVKDKDLKVLIPQSLGESLSGLVIHVVSANTSVQDTICDKLSIKTVSGILTLNDVQVDTLTADSVSGSITIAGAVQTLRCDSVSSDVSVMLTDAPISIKANTVSGKVTLTLEEDTGYSLDYETVSGVYHSDFPETTTDNIRVHTGNADDDPADIKVSTVSGNLYMTKNKLS